jgi:murein L,D-transpeptidase YafK
MARLLPFFILTMISSASQSSFKAVQLQHLRVKNAYDEKEEIIQEYFNKKKILFTGFSLFVRVIKKEKKLEAWVSERGKNTFTLLHTYDFCSTSGILGPKRLEGDLQIPEGIYYINHFNPKSNFHLSLGINYPNASDYVFSNKKKPGGEIYIHGNCVTVGCVPITDDKIKELYILAVEAKNNGQDKIPVYIFPCRLDEPELYSLREEFSDFPKTLSLWRNLQSIYQDFESLKVLRPVKTNAHGYYTF